MSINSGANFRWCACGVLSGFKCLSCDGFGSYLLPLNLTVFVSPSCTRVKDLVLSITAYGLTRWE